MALLNDNDYEFIEKYLRDELGQEEQSGFRKRLTEDIDFARAYKIEQDIQDALILREHERLGKSIGYIYDDVSGSSNNTDKIIPKWDWKKWFVLFVFCILLSLLLFFYLKQNSFGGKVDTDKIFAENFIKPAWDNSRNNSGNNLDLRRAYSNNDCNKLLEAAKESGYFQLYLGICYLDSGLYENAEKELVSLQSNPNFNDQATWYLALTYLKEGDGISSIRELNRLINNEIPSTPAIKNMAGDLLELIE